MKCNWFLSQQGLKLVDFAQGVTDVAISVCCSFPSTLPKMMTKQAMRKTATRRVYDVVNGLQALGIIYRAEGSKQVDWDFARCFIPGSNKGCHVVVTDVPIEEEEESDEEEDAEHIKVEDNDNDCEDQDSDEDYGDDNKKQKKKPVVKKVVPRRQAKRGRPSGAGVRTKKVTLVTGDGSTKKNSFPKAPVQEKKKHCTRTRTYNNANAMAEKKRLAALKASGGDDEKRDPTYITSASDVNTASTSASPQTSTSKMSTSFVLGVMDHVAERLGQGNHMDWDKDNPIDVFIIRLMSNAEFEEFERKFAIVRRDPSDFAARKQATVTYYRRRRRAFEEHMKRPAPVVPSFIMPVQKVIYATSLSDVEVKN
jgi:hypothetical protein